MMIIEFGYVLWLENDIRILENNIKFYQFILLLINDFYSIRRVIKLLFWNIQ